MVRDRARFGNSGYFERMRESSGPKWVVFIVLVLATAIVPNTVPSVVAPTTPQPSTFFFHRQTTKTLDTVTTNLWANTTQGWSATVQTEQRTVSGSSPGLWHFYSEPAVAGNVTLTGPLTFILYFSSSSGTGTGTVITGNVNKVTSTGSVVSLAVGSLSSAPISQTITGYTITLPSNTYQVEAGAILDFAITVNIPGSTSKTITLSYDSPPNTSQVSITFQQRVGITSFSSFNQTGVSTGFFSRNWTASGRQVTLRASMFDALGLYDLGMVHSNITSPAGSALLTNSPLVLVQGMSQDYAGVWSLNWTYSPNDLSGTYVSRLGVVDNGGLSMTMQLSYTVFASWVLNLQALSLDPTPVPILGASVTVFIGSVAVYNGVSNVSGWVSPRDILLRDNATYLIKVFWQGSLVNQTAAYHPTSSLTSALYLSVYHVDFSKVFLDGNGSPLPQPPSSIQLYYPNGTLASLNPSTAYLLPSGTYSISAVTWKGVDVTSTAVAFNPKTGLFPVKLQIYDLTILVVDQDGHAIPGATVTLALGTQTVLQDTTHNDGTLVIHALPKGQYIIQVNSQSQTVRSNVDLSQNTISKLQVNLAATTWVSQSLGWIILGAAVAGLLGYGEFYRTRHPYTEEPFDYLDSLTGGFRDGDTVLIEGDTGTGKTTMCEQLAHRALKLGYPVVYLTYDKPESVRQGMKARGWDTSLYEKTQQFQLLDCELTRRQGVDRSLGILENFYDTTVLDLAISSALVQFTTEKPVLLVDSAYQLVEQANVNGLANLMLETSAKVKKLKGRFFMAVSKTASKPAVSELEGVMDSVVELTTTTVQGKTITQLAVKKMRGRKFDNRAVTIRLHPAKGIVFQIPKSRHAKNKPPSASKA